MLSKLPTDCVNLWGHMILSIGMNVCVCVCVCWPQVKFQPQVGFWFLLVFPYMAGCINFVFSCYSIVHNFEEARMLLMNILYCACTELLAIETHLKKLCKLSRPEDTVKLVKH